MTTEEIDAPGHRKEPKVMERSKPDVVRDFQRLMYLEGMSGMRSWQSTSWCGVSMFKNPQDLLMYAQILWEQRPKVLIETGTWSGGSALFFAHMMDQIGHGKVVTVDIEGDTKWHPPHPRIAYIKGESSVSPNAIAEVKHWVDFYAETNREGTNHRAPDTMVILDSLHTEEHVLAELDAYAGLVTGGQYLVVEDTEISGHPVLEDSGPGPYEACEKWFPKHPEFKHDEMKQTQYMWSSHNWYKRQRT